MENSVPILEMSHVSKRFGNIVANDDVSLSVYPGEILALLGENGSGKTTLMNILSGIYYPDEGQIYVNDEPVTIRSPKDSFDLKIGMIHQHFKLVEVLSAVENIVLGLPGKLDLKKAAADIRSICERFGFEVDPYEKIYNMSVSQKQTVEIVKVLYRGANILILDEPTAVLTPQESEKLFAILRNMKDAGHAIIIITHKMNEVMDISDRVSILRKGKYVGSYVTCEISAEDLTDNMVGHHVSLNIDRPDPVDPKDRLMVTDLTVKNSDGIIKLDHVSFTVRTGEILGIAGIAGSGQRELLEAIAGLQPIEEGSIIYINDDDSIENLLGKTPIEIQNMGVSLSFVPEDRLGMGLVGNMSLSENMMLRSYRKGGLMFTDRRSPARLAEQVVKDLEVNTPGITTAVRKLSGGNVQKVLVGREIASAPTVLLTAYAVRGLDINSSYTIYNLINAQKKAGVAVVYVGEDLDVLVELCDKILVLCDGKVSGIVDGRTTDKNKIGMMMTRTGGKDEK